MSRGANLTFNLFGKDHTASSALRKVGDQSEDTHRKFGAFGKGASKAAMGVAAGVAAVGVGAAIAGKQLFDMGKAAAEDAAGQKRLELALKNTTGATERQVAAVEDWITAQGRSLGVADDQLRPALARLAQSTKDVGEAQGLATIAMDIAAGSGRSLESVAAALAKAHDGNTGALARLGVQTKDAEGKTLSFEEIVKQAADTFSGQASAGADTLAGKMGRIRLRFDEAKEALGERLLPAGEALVDWFLDSLMPTLEDAGDIFEGMADAVEEASGPMKDLGGEILPSIGDGLFLITQYIPEIVGSANKLASLTVRTFMGLAVVTLGAADAVMTLGAAIQVGDARAEAFAERDRFRKWKDDAIRNMDAVADGLMDAGNALDDYGDKARNIKRAELTADINDLTSKILKAKVALQDPEISKERASKLKADISDLTEKVATARGKLAMIDDKTVTVTAKVVFKDQRGRTLSPGQVSRLVPGLAAGGLVRGPGTGTSDTAGLYALSNGEYVMRASAVDRYGVGFFDALNGGAGVAAVAGSGSGASGGVTVNVYGGLDSSEAIARRVQTVLLDYKRRQGVALGLS